MTRQAVSTLLLVTSIESMADVDRILAQLQAAAASKWPEWLQSQVAALLEDQASGSATGEQDNPHMCRSRPPKRFSPRSPSRALRHVRSPLRDSSSTPVKHPPAPAGGRPEWNPQWRQSSAGGELGTVHMPPPPARRHTDSSPSDASGWGSLGEGEAIPRLPGHHLMWPAALRSMSGHPPGRKKGGSAAGEVRPWPGVQDVGAITAPVRWADPALGGRAKHGTNPLRPGPPRLGFFRRKSCHCQKYSRRVSCLTRRKRTSGIRSAKVST